ncbi:MAG: hypothetical protein LBR64_10690 [Dysgonamonadaceae bacterium]|jgi:hypothetical protein|nr:hypothetical protein [Dysgonamonadaceae bacterium]
MATPIRMAPVLYGKEAEFFYEQWAKMRETPLKRPISKQEREDIITSMKRDRVIL